MRYRRDVPRGDEAAIQAETVHIRAHLSAVASRDDDPDAHADDVTIEVVDHIEGDQNVVSVIGELDAEPDAEYLRDDYDPGAEPPVEFVPYENPADEQRYDRDAFAEWRAAT